MRTVIIFLFISVSAAGLAQQRYYTQTGHIDFYSHAPLEDIRSNNDQVAAFLYTESGELSFGVLIKSFEFEKALMQKHFNENYMESNEYPKAVFKGKIQNFNSIDLSKPGKIEVDVVGELIIRNIKKNITTKATLDIKKDEIVASSTFIAKPSDFNITIPHTVKDNIAKEIEVNVLVTLKPY